MNNVILYIATSKDGFIADKDGGVDWLPQPDEANKSDSDNDTDEFCYKALLNRISIIVMGNNSYQQILGFGDWAWKDKTTYVFSYEPLALNENNIFFVNEVPAIFIERIKKEKPNQDIWLLGGAQLTKSFAQENLIDECIITVVPVSIGQGIKLELPYENFTLTQTKPCSMNIVQKFYTRKTS